MDDRGRPWTSRPIAPKVTHTALSGGVPDAVRAVRPETPRRVGLSLMGTLSAAALRRRRPCFELSETVRPF